MRVLYGILSYRSDSRASCYIARWLNRICTTLMHFRQSLRTVKLLMDDHLCIAPVLNHLRALSALILLRLRSHTIVGCRDGRSRVCDGLFWRDWLLINCAECIGICVVDHNRAKTLFSEETTRQLRLHFMTWRRNTVKTAHRVVHLFRLIAAFRLLESR